MQSKAPPLEVGFGLDELRAAIIAAIGSKLFLTVPEVSDLTRVDQRTLRRAIGDRQITAVRIGNTWRVPTVAVLRMAELDGTTPENAASAGAAIPTLAVIKTPDATSNGPNDNQPIAG